MKQVNLIELEQQAFESLYKGAYSEAISGYERCIDTNPFYFPYYWQLGLATLFQGDEITAKTIWLSLLMQVNHEESNVLIAELVQYLKAASLIQFKLGNFELAENVCRQNIDLTPNDAELYYNIGMCLKCRNENNEAIDFFKKTIEINPYFAQAYSSLGACLKDRSISEIDEAIKNIQRAIELEPTLAEAYCNLGVCFLDEGKLDEATKCLDEAIELKPDLAEAYYHLGRCLWSKGESKQAISKLREAAVLKPEFTKSIRAIQEFIQCEQAGYAPLVKEGHNVWDAIIFKDDNLYRLFYLVGDSQASPFWSVGSLAAAISSDLKIWKYIGVVLQPDPVCKWQSGRILSGSVYKENGVYYLFYSASPPKPLVFEEGIGLATSKDGISWQYGSEQFVIPDTKFYSSSLRDGVERHWGWRDPYIFKDPKTKKYYLFITTSFRGEHPTFRGCIGLAVSNNVDGPYEVLPPAAYPVIPGTNEGIFYEMERPQVIYRDGKYHLFFSAGTSRINPKWIKQVGREQLTESPLYWYVSDNVMGPFVPSSSKPIVKGSENISLYGTSFVEAPSGQLIACGTNICTFTLEVSERFPVFWESDSIEILLDSSTTIAN